MNGIRSIIRIVPAVVLTVALATACSSASGVPFIDLSERAPTTSTGRTGVEPIRIAIAAILSPQGNVSSYGGLADYLAQRIDRPIELVQRRTYQEVNALLVSGEVDIGFICTSAYVRGHDEFGLRLLAAPEVRGSLSYYSDLIVSADDEASTMEDLRGAVFAFTDPLSTTGRFYPTHLVRSVGSEPETFFSDTFYTYSHEAAIRAVADGLADGAGVDSLVLAFMLEAQPDLPVRVIDRSPAFAIPPVVASPHLSAGEAEEIQRLLLGLADDPAARGVLEAMGVDRFVTIEDDAYESVRRLLAEFEGA